MQFTMTTIPMHSYIIVIMVLTQNACIVPHREDWIIKSGELWDTFWVNYGMSPVNIKINYKERIIKHQKWLKWITILIIIILSSLSLSWWLPLYSSLFLSLYFSFFSLVQSSSWSIFPFSFPLLSLLFDFLLRPWSEP